MNDARKYSKKNDEKNSTDRRQCGQVQTGRGRVHGPGHEDTRPRQSYPRYPVRDPESCDSLRAYRNQPGPGRQAEPETEDDPVSVAGGNPRLHAVLDACVAERPVHAPSADIIRLLLLTGCRRGEIVNLQWREVGKDILELMDSKTGPRTVFLSPKAKAVIDHQPRSDSPWVFPSPTLSTVWKRFQVKLLQQGPANHTRIFTERPMEEQ